MILLDPLIRKTFQTEIAKMELSRDLYEGVTRHERKEKFFTNMKAEVNKIREARLAKAKRPLKADEIEWMVKSMTRFFVSGVKAESDYRVASDAAKTLEKVKADTLADLDATASGKPQGDFADIVSVVGDGDATERVDTDV